MNLFTLHLPPLAPYAVRTYFHQEIFYFQWGKIEVSVEFPQSHYSILQAKLGWPHQVLINPKEFTTMPRMCPWGNLLQNHQKGKLSLGFDAQTKAGQRMRQSAKARGVGKGGVEGMTHLPRIKGVILKPLILNANGTCGLGEFLASEIMELFHRYFIFVAFLARGALFFQPKLLYDRKTQGLTLTTPYHFPV